MDFNLMYWASTCQISVLENAVKIIEQGYTTRCIRLIGTFINLFNCFFAAAKLNLLMHNGELPDPGVPTPRMTIQPPCSKSNSEACPPPPDPPFLYRASMSIAHH